MVNQGVAMRTNPNLNQTMQCHPQSKLDPFQGLSNKARMVIESVENSKKRIDKRGSAITTSGTVSCEKADISRAYCSKEAKNNTVSGTQADSQAH